MADETKNLEPQLVAMAHLLVLLAKLLRAKGAFDPQHLQRHIDELEEALAGRGHTEAADTLGKLARRLFSEQAPFSGLAA